jgi:hypothetical protein
MMLVERSAMTVEGISHEAKGFQREKNVQTPMNEAKPERIVRL